MVRGLSIVCLSCPTMVVGCLNIPAIIASFMLSDNRAEVQCKICYSLPDTLPIRGVSGYNQCPILFVPYKNGNHFAGFFGN